MNLTILQGDCLASMRKLPNESVNCCVTSPPYFAIPPYYGIMQLWQTKVNSRKASGEGNQPSSRKANTGDHADRIGIRNGLLLSTSKSSGQRVTLRLKLDVPTLPLSFGLGSTRYRAGAPVRRGRLSTGERKAKRTQCTANAGARITTGKADAHRSASLSTRQKSGRKPVPPFGSEIKRRVSVVLFAAKIRTNYTSITLSLLR